MNGYGGWEHKDLDEKTINNLEKLFNDLMFPDVFAGIFPKPLSQDYKKSGKVLKV